MTEIPNDLNAVLTGGLEHGNERGKIVAAAGIDEVPANRIPRGRDADTAQQFVILTDLPIMLRERDHVYPPAGAIDMTGGLVSRHPERLEQARRWRWLRRAVHFRR